MKHPILDSLDDTEALLNWSLIEQILSSIYSSHTGRPSHPLLRLFRSLLTGLWYQLSDVQLAQFLYRDLLFRKFCHLTLGGDVPDGTPKRDPDASWPVKKSTSGFSVHTGVDKDGFIHRQSLTPPPGPVHDNQEPDTLLLGDESALSADAAYSSYSSAATRDTWKRRGIDDQVQRKGRPAQPLSSEDHRRNQDIAVTRSGGERPFATYKQHDGLARTRFMSLVKNARV